jgi:aryl-alcohol dehydrogenase-like predicted oxidoreductase
VVRELLPQAARRGLGVILMRPLAVGALTRSTPPPAELKFLENYGLTTWAQALLNWGVSDPRVTVTIPATGDVRHAAENCAVGAARRFDPEARDRVAALASRL